MEQEKLGKQYGKTKQTDKQDGKNKSNLTNNMEKQKKLDKQCGNTKNLANNTETQKA